MLPYASSHLPEDKPGRLFVPSFAVLLPMGFTWPLKSPKEPVSSYLAFPPLPQMHAAVSLCCTFPEVAFGGRYPPSSPCEARTFLIHCLSAIVHATVRLTHEIYFNINSLCCQIPKFISQLIFSMKKSIIINC